MPSTLYLTDEPSEVAGYLRATLGVRADATSLVRAVTNTLVTGGSTPITRTPGGTPLKWITDPLSAVSLTAAAWQLHLWALESDAAANAALRLDVTRWTAGVEGASVLADTPTAEIGTAVADYARTTAVATATSLVDRDRLVIAPSLKDAASAMAAGYTVTVSYNGELGDAEGDSYVLCPDTLATTFALPASTLLGIRYALKDADATNPFLSDLELTQAWGTALREYSRDRPLRVATSLSGDGVSYDFPMPRRWVPGLSRLIEVEYPAGQQQRVVVDPNEWELVETALGPQPVRSLRFTTSVPEVGTDNLVLRYTTRHAHSDEFSTIPADDLPFVVDLAASVAATYAAARAAATSDSTIAADAVDYQSGTDRWLKVASACRKRYEEHIGVNAAAPAAGLTREWDVNQSWSGDFLLHGRRRR
jgi:hypothetical protein